MDPLHLPLAVKLVAAVALLIAVNEISPGVAPTVLVLVALYLTLTRSEQVAAVVQKASTSFQATIQPPVDPRAGR